MAGLLYNYQPPPSPGVLKPLFAFVGRSAPTKALAGASSVPAAARRARRTTRQPRPSTSPSSSAVASTRDKPVRLGLTFLRDKQASSLFVVQVDNENRMAGIVPISLLVDRRVMESFSDVDPKPSKPGLSSYLQPMGSQEPAGSCKFLDHARLLFSRSTPVVQLARRLQDLIGSLAILTVRSATPSSSLAASKQGER
jgi:hypothetical protein